MTLLDEELRARIDAVKGKEPRGDTRLRFYAAEPRDGLYDLALESNHDTDFVIEAPLFTEYKAAYEKLETLKQRIESEGTPVSNWAIDVAGARKTGLPPPKVPIARLTDEQREDLKWARGFIATNAAPDRNRLALVLELLKKLAEES